MPSNMHMTAADNVLRGAAVFEPHKRLYDGRRGYVVVDNAFRNYGAVLAIVAAGIINGATTTNLPNIGTTTYTPATDGTAPLNNAGRPATATVQGTDGVSRLCYVMDVPRNLSLNVTHASSIVALTVLAQGLDEYLQPMSELFTITATGTTKTAAGKKAFKYLYSMAITSAGNAQTDTVNLAWANVLGLPYRVDDGGRVTPAGNGVLDTTGTVTKADDTSPATTTTGDVRGTYAPSSAPDGTKKYFASVFPTDPQTAQPLGLFGNPQV